MEFAPDIGAMAANFVGKSQAYSVVPKPPSDSPVIYNLFVFTE